MKLRLTLLLLIVWGWATLSVQAQRCGAHEVNKELEALFPQMKSKEKKVDDEIRKLGMQRYLRKLGIKGISDLRTGGAYTGPIYEIPVVVHVIESKSADRADLALTDEQIRTWLENCNRMFATTYGSNYYPEGDGAEGGTVMPFRLVLAKRSPQCQPTTGIIRYDGSTILNYDEKGLNRANTDGATMEQIRTLAPHWQDGAYYNIYVVAGIDSNFAYNGGIAGWAAFPTASAAYYETVMKVRVVTREGDSTLAHELGHAFGLKHTFDDAKPKVCPTEADCSAEGDLVCDTEPSISMLDVWPLPSNNDINTCTGQAYQGVQYNVMNYSADTRKFTQGQRERALAQFLTHKGGLLRSKAHLDVTEDVNLNMVAAQCLPQGIEKVANTGIGMSRIILGDIDNSSATIAEANPIYYTDYTTKTCVSRSYTDITDGVRQTLTIQVEGLNNMRLTVWIDYNNDGTFTTDEFVNAVIVPAGQTEVAITFTPPSTAVKEQYLRMRIRGDLAQVGRGACDKLYAGEIEDYAVRIVCPQTVDEAEVEAVLASEGFVGGYTADQLATLTSLYAAYQTDKTNCSAKANVVNEVTRLVTEAKISFDATKYYRLYAANNGDVLYVDYVNNRVASRTQSDASKVDEFWKLSALDGTAQIVNPNTGTGISSVNGDLAAGANALLSNVGVAKFSMKFENTSLVIAPEFRLKAIESINIPISKQYATFCYPFAVQPNDASSVIYTVNSVSGKDAVVNIVNGIVPANTPVIVKGENNSVYVMNIVYDNSQPVATLSGNLLQGVLAPQNVSEHTFIIWTNENNETGFYQIAEAGLLGANKAYLLLPNAGSSPYYKINISDGTTQIIDAKNEVFKQVQYYDLSGKPVKILVPGVVYLTSEGKKVIFKQQ